MKLCECSCGKPVSKIEVQFLKGHSTKGKTFEEIYGEEKAKKMRQSCRDRLKGKTYEEVYGKETGKKMRQFFREKMTGKNNYMYGKHHSKKTRQIMSEKAKGRKPWNIGIKAPQISKALKGKYTGKKSWWFGRHHTKETRLLMRTKCMGKLNHRYGKSPSIKTRRLIAEKNRGNKVNLGRKYPKDLYPNHGVRNKPEVHKKIGKAIKLAWQRPESGFNSKNYMTRLVKRLVERPTSYEQKIIDLCKKYNLPFRYVGDGQVFVGRLNPDFVNTNGKKQIIETYCNHWHPGDYEKSRRKRLLELGFKTLFLNDNDLYIHDWEKICLEKINHFLRSK